MKSRNQLLSFFVPLPWLWALVATWIISSSSSAAYQPSTDDSGSRTPPQRNHALSPEPHCYARIDYSSANCYITDHYEKYPVDKPYFAQDHCVHAIWNARTTFAPSFRNSLHDDGFCLLPHHTQVADWRDLDQIRYTYLSELTEIVQEQFAANKIRHLVFWHPMLRGSNVNQRNHPEAELAQTPSMAVANVAHIDLDFGAFDTQGVELLDMVAKTAVRTTISGSNAADAAASTATKVDTAAIQNDMAQGYRFCVINAWRNTASTPIRTAPLALLKPYYDKATQQQQRNILQAAFPDSVPCPRQSRWYTYPRMTQDELLLFYQYDRDVRVASDVWHSALTNNLIVTSSSSNTSNTRSHNSMEKQEDDSSTASRQAASKATPPRKSFDIRMLLVLDEIVDPAHDRFRPDRTRALPDPEK